MSALKQHEKFTNKCATKNANMDRKVSQELAEFLKKRGKEPYSSTGLGKKAFLKVPNEPALILG